MTEPISELRKKAQQILNTRNETPELVSEMDIQTLLNEIQTYQVELEIQNEELRTAQKDLEQSRDRFLKLYHEAPIGYLVLEKSGMILDTNETLARMLGLVRSQIIQKPFSRFISPRDYYLFFSRFRNFFKNPGKNFLDIALMLPDGNSFEARLDGRYLSADIQTMDKTLVNHLLVTVSDISLQKEMEESLARSEMEFRTTFYALADGIISTDETGVIQRINDAAQTLTRWREAEARGKHLDTVYTRVNEQTLMPEPSFVQRLIENPGQTEFKQESLLVSRKGNKIPISESASPVFNALGIVTGLVVIFHNETRDRISRSKLSARLQMIEYARDFAFDEMVTRSLDLIGHLTDSPAGFLHLVEPNQKTISVQYWSTRTREQLCRTPGINRHYSLDQAGIWADCVHQRKPIIINDYLLSPQHNGLPTGHLDIHRMITVPVIHQGLVRMVLGIGNKPEPYTSQDADLVAYLAEIIWEIICRKQMKERILFLHKMESIATLTAGFAHEFNNILTMIVGNAELCADTPDADETLRDRLGDILSAGMRGKEIIRQLMYFSRASDPGQERFNICDAARKAVDFIRSSLPDTIRLELTTPDTCNAVTGNPGLIYQVVVTLCTNAIQAMADTHGTIHLSVHDCVLTAPACFQNQELKPGEYTCLEVADTGVGIPPENLHRVFDPFFTTRQKYESCGLGLPMVFGIMKSWQGAIFIHSHPNQGTRVTCFFPSDRQTPPPDDPVIRLTAPQKSLRVLCVDDEDGILRISRIYLERMGHQAIIRQDPREAIEDFRKTPDAFDLVITDYVMPDVSGEKLIEEIRTIRTDIPVILCTGYQDRVQPDAPDTRADVLLQKPFRKAEMADAILKAMKYAESAPPGKDLP